MTTTARSTPLLVLPAILTAGLGWWVWSMESGVGVGAVEPTVVEPRDEPGTAGGAALELELPEEPAPAAADPLADEHAAVVRTEVEPVPLAELGDGVWLRGRVLDAEGEPWGEARLRLVLIYPRDKMDPKKALVTSDLKLDARGGFLQNIQGIVNLYGRSMRRSGSLTLRIEADGTWLAAELPLVLPTATEVGQDCGDLLMGGAPPLVAGRVVDHNGKPVGGAKVQVEVLGHRRGPGPRPRRRALAHRAAGGRGG